jgi:hypothetical protein
MFSTPVKHFSQQASDLGHTPWAASPTKQPISMLLLRYFPGLSLTPFLVSHRKGYMMY